MNIGNIKFNITCFLDIDVVDQLREYDKNIIIQSEQDNYNSTEHNVNDKDIDKQSSINTTEGNKEILSKSSKFVIKTIEIFFTLTIN